MPTYVYRCSKCQSEVEIIKSITDNTVPICTCSPGDTNEMDIVIQATGFILKGKGWAKDGYSK